MGSRVNAIPSRTGRGRGYRLLCSDAVPTTSARTTLCHLTPAPGTTRRGESSPGHRSLRISAQDQLLPPSLCNSLQGLGSLGIHARRAPHDGSASVPTEPWLFTLSMHSDRHVVGHALCQAITRAPTWHRIRCDRRIAPVHQGQDRSVDHAATVVSYRTQACHLRSQDVA